MQYESIVNGWLKGDDSVEGMENPAGSLYVEGNARTEAAMSNKQFCMLTRCSSCTASFPTYCC